MDSNKVPIYKNTKIILGVVVVLVLIVIVYSSSNGGDVQKQEDLSATTTQSNKGGSVSAPSKIQAKPATKTTNTTKPASTNVSPTTATSNAARVSVNIKGYAFNPQVLTVKKGTTVTWTNNDTMSHVVTGEQNRGPGSGTLVIGDSYSYTFDKVGDFPYFCSLHTYMRGAVVVTE